ncbi:otefin [Calliphora vicina]|uniref:otefin n=1 Tax=Calliphora vicina TaxID=7373 RepID=UPI00325BBEEE
MAALEALNNKELRQKCIEYGMPNVPVTDSSRKILIRRLEAAMSGKPVATTPAKSNRRETMHVSKPSEVASSPKITINNNNATKTATAASNRPSRRTIAVPERHVATTTTVSEPEYSDVSPDRVEPEPIRVKTKTPEKPPTLYPKLPAKEPSPKPQHLSKTGVVTTSYMQETTPINKTYAAPDEIDLVEDFVVAAEPVKKAMSNPPKFSYVPVSEPKVTTTAPLTASLSSSTRYSSLDSYNYKKPNYLSSTNVRKSYIPPSTNYSKPSMTTQYAQSYDAEIEDDEEDEDYEDDEEDVVLVEESPIKDAETPFLSQFARNLETLKATPIRHSVGPTKITPPKPTTLRNRDNVYSRRTIGTPSSNINPRRTIKSAQNAENSEFRQFILALEEKYHLKHSLILISIFIMAVFIYVFFIQSV